MDNMLKKRTYIGINITVHVIILFSFLCLFFFLYVSKMESQAFKDEVGSLIKKTVPAVLNPRKESVAPLLQKASPFLEYVKNQYSSPEKSSEKQNYYIKFFAGFVVLFLSSIALSIILTLQFDCSKHVPIKKILLENTVTFILVGIIEYLFFTKFAAKFIPAPPTLMIKTIISSLQQSFN